MATVLVGIGLSATAASVVTSVAVSVGLGLVYQALTPPVTIEQEGARLESSRITTSTEGSPISRVTGSVRLGGQMIWATRFKETITTNTQTSGGKGGGPKTVSKTTEYTYTCSFAVALCRGTPCAGLLNVWADGKILDLSELTYRFYPGDFTQTVDPLIEITEGIGTVPAFRGVSYVVFEDMPLGEYGNRIPQISCEVFVPPTSDNIVDSLESALNAVHITPITGEKTYGTDIYTLDDLRGNNTPLNGNTPFAESDFVVSLNQLNTGCSGVSSASVVSTWFGSSVSANLCRVEPKVLCKNITEEILPKPWKVSGLLRDSARTVSYENNQKIDWNITGGLTTLSIQLISSEAGTITLNAPADFTDGETLAEAINTSYAQALTKCVATWDGVAIVTLQDRSEQADTTISVLVSDVNAPDAQDFPSSLGGNAVFGGTPSDVSIREAITRIKERGWRAMFYPLLIMDCVDFPWRGRIQANTAADITDFVGTASPSDFTLDADGEVTYTGPDEWTHRRMILHYATLLSDVLVAGDAFIIGSEMVGLTESNGAWASSLVSLIADVKSVLPSGVVVSYASDWSEYQQPSLAQVWSSADFIGIDNYMPVTDWRDAADEIYTVEELQNGIEGGEYYDYYYASDFDRLNGIKTSITDPSLRQKDVRYWQNTNFPTKDVWFTAFGCPAVNKGTNQPDVLFDGFSVESGFPHFSNKSRDDLIQRLYYEATIDYWKNVAPSSHIDTSNMFAWAWDARPFPYFPALSSVWTDTETWKKGYQLNGRFNVIKLPDLIVYLCQEAGIPPNKVDVSAIASGSQVVHGIHVANIINTRQVLENILETYVLDVYENGDRLVFYPKNVPNEVTIEFDDFILSDDVKSYDRTRVQDTELPDRTKVSFLDKNRAYNAASVDGHTVTGKSDRVNRFTSICVINTAYAKNLANILTQQAWIGRDSISFSLPISYVNLLPGDHFDLNLGGTTLQYKIVEITLSDRVEVEAMATNYSMYDIPKDFDEDIFINSGTTFGRSFVVLAEIPLFSDTFAENNWSPRIVAYQKPWPGSVDFYEDDFFGGNTLNTTVPVSGIVGELLSDLNAPVSVELWDDSNYLDVFLYDPSASLTSATELAVLNGANALAVSTANGEWEILQYRTAALIGQNTYRLSNLLRGRLGTEHYIGKPSPAGSVVFVANQNSYGFLEGTHERLNIPRNYIYGPNGVNTSDSRYTNVELTPRGVALRPYSPVQLETKFATNGDITLSWIRRTRFGGDSWEISTPPLNEDFEKYEIEILDAPFPVGSPVRQFVVDNATNVLYSAADQTTDFGAPQTHVDWVCYQMSSLYGRGTPGIGK